MTVLTSVSSRTTHTQITERRRNRALMKTNQYKQYITGQLALIVCPQCRRLRRRERERERERETETETDRQTAEVQCNSVNTGLKEPSQLPCHSVNFQVTSSSICFAGHIIFQLRRRSADYKRRSKRQRAVSHDDLRKAHDHPATQADKLPYLIELNPRGIAQFTVDKYAALDRYKQLAIVDLKSCRT